MRDLRHPGEFDRYGAAITTDALVTEAVLGAAYAWSCRRPYLRGYLVLSAAVTSGKS